MQDIMTRSLGSNQFVSKFDEAKKAKFSFKRVLSRILFSKRTWKIAFVALFVLISYTAYREFISNYTLQKPWASKNNESYLNVFNERATCLTQLDTLQNNQDLFQ